MDINALLLFALTEFFLSMSPGPAVFLIVSQGMRSGHSASIYGALGVLAGNATYFAISALGIGAIIATSQTMFLIIKSVGAVYLIYLGCKTIYDSFLKRQQTSPATPEINTQMLFRQGLLMQLANPQAILFFVALLPQFLNPATNTVQQLVILGFISIFVEFPILFVYGGLAAKGGAMLKNSRFFKWLDRIAGAFLVGAGIKLALTRQN